MKVSREIIQASPKVLALRLAGDLEEVTMREIERGFDEAVKADQPRHILLDLSGVAFAGSAFFSTLVFWNEEVKKGGGQLVLFGVPPTVASTMRIFTLDRLLTVRPDQAAALAALPKA